jgi:hypothetical protein
MKNLPLIIGGVIVLSLLNPAVASADTGSFIDDLNRNGVDVSTDEMQDDAVTLGRALCDVYRTSPPVGVNPNHDAMDLLTRPPNPDSSDVAAVWIVASVDYICPQYKYLLP